MLHSAKQIMLSELVLVLQSDYPSMEGRLDRAMMQKAAN